MGTVSSLWLVIDTCGEVASLALGAGETLHGLEELPRQRASAGMIDAMQRLVTAAGCRVTDLQGIGVVSGPGSFTGVRTGLSVAKGLCEAASLALVMVSRLAVLAHAAGVEDGYAALDAGRGELYVRAARDGSEWLCADAELLELAAGSRVVVAEASLLDRLQRLQPTLYALNAGAALPRVVAKLPGGTANPALADAYYLREEAAIYKRTAGGTP